MFRDFDVADDASPVSGFLLPYCFEGYRSLSDRLGQNAETGKILIPCLANFVLSRQVVALQNILSFLFRGFRHGAYNALRSLETLQKCLGSIEAG